MKSKGTLLIVITSCIAMLPVYAQINVRAGFTVNELNAIHGRVHNDTCGVLTGATDAFDPQYEVEYPPITPDNTFDAHWLTSDGAWVRVDLRRPPDRNKPPFMVEYTMEFAFSRSTDTMNIGWHGIPSTIDSIHIEDSIPATPPGSFVHKVITHTTPPVDSLLWWKPNGIDITQLRFRVFYNQSATAVGDVPVVVPTASLLITPNPAHDHVRIAGRIGATIIVSDLLGRELRRISVSNDGIVVSLAGISPGLYSVALVDHLLVSRALMIVE